MLLRHETIRAMAKGRIAMLGVQGHDVSGLAGELESIPDSYDALVAFGRKLNHVPMRSDFPYTEPQGLQDIRAARPTARADILGSYRRDMELRDKIFGGVYGRIAGCILGKPLEMGWNHGDIRRYLEGAGAWPLRDFVPPVSPTQKEPLRRDCIESTRGFVRCAQEDDDINYLVIGLKAIEEKGAEFSTQDIAMLWRENIPYGWTWGPEHSRYYLLAGLWMDHGAKLPADAEWEEYRAFLNDGEELIGAMIRGDAFGLVNPGRPELAAEFAWRDARLTHARTGMYAEMWVAATVAAAFHTHDPLAAIEAGLGQLPEKSRYAEAVREAIQICAEEPDWLDAYRRIDKKWGYLGHAGTINETGAIINALLHSVDGDTGALDYESVITKTVAQGWDVDCSGATAGCIAGVLTGFSGIPPRWHEPLHDTMYTAVATERETRISAIAERMVQAEKIVRHAAKIRG